MELSNKTAREIYEHLKANPRRKPFGFGKRAALINIDLQRAYTDIGTYKTAYQTDPEQLDHINNLAALCRRAGFPVVWTYVAYIKSGKDALAWPLRHDTPDSPQNIKEGSERAQLSAKLVVDRDNDFILNKRMPSAFHETPLSSFLNWQGIDTAIITGGSTSGCVRATAIDALSYGLRPHVIEECVADVHESPHFANLYDMSIKYADITPLSSVVTWLESQPAQARA